VQTRTRRAKRAWSAEDDRSLDAILALRRAWYTRGGRLTLAALGLDARVVTFVVSGLCPRHGQFVREWTGRILDPLPLEARCPAADRCQQTSPVFVLV
jgi:hypothetical protein